MHDLMAGQSHECIGHLLEAALSLLYPETVVPENLRRVFPSGKSRDPVGAPKTWIPAGAGMTMWDFFSR
jgi:hypothetical protein